MSTWICLLRGVNLGAQNKLNMPALRAALTEAGLSDVRTYLQSGNVIAGSNAARSARRSTYLLIWVQSDFQLAHERGLARDIATATSRDAAECQEFWDHWMDAEIPFLERGMSLVPR